MSGSRRGNNEGSKAWQRADGLWRVEVTIPGTQKVKALYGHSQTEVNEKRVAFLKKYLYDGLPMEDGRLTVGGHLRDWLATRDGIRASTAACYRVSIENHLIPELGHVKLAKLTPRDVRAALFRLKDKKLGPKSEKTLSPRTIQLARSVLRAAIEQAVKDGDLARNVVALVESPRVEREPIVPLSPEQVETFLSGVEGDSLEALYVVAFSTGLRQGELLGLRWQDIDFETQEIRVVQARLRNGKVGTAEKPGARESLFGPPKSRSSRRGVTMPDMAAQALWRHQSAHRERKRIAGDDWREYGLIFTTWKGTPLDGVNLGRYFKAHLKRLQLPAARFHDCRHTAASLLLSRGVSLKVIQDVLGHSQISLTANTYTHVMPALKKEAAQVMDDMFPHRGKRRSSDGVSDGIESRKGAASANSYVKQ